MRLHHVSAETVVGSLLTEVIDLRRCNDSPAGGMGGFGGQGRMAGVTSPSRRGAANAPVSEHPCAGHPSAGHPSAGHCDVYRPIAIRCTSPLCGPHFGSAILATRSAFHLSCSYSLDRPIGYSTRRDQRPNRTIARGVHLENEPACEFYCVPSS